MSAAGLRSLLLFAGIASALSPAGAIDRGAAREAWRSFEASMQSAAAAAGRGELAAAEVSYGEALRIASDLGEGTLRYARAVDGLADVRRLQGRYEEAASAYRETLARFEHLLGPDQPRVATTMHNLGVVLLELDRTGEAGDLFVRSREIWSRRLGASCPEVAVSLEASAALLRRTGRPEEAGALLERAARIRAVAGSQGAGAMANGIE